MKPLKILQFFKSKNSFNLRGKRNLSYELFVNEIQNKLSKLSFEEQFVAVNITDPTLFITTICALWELGHTPILYNYLTPMEEILNDQKDIPFKSLLTDSDSEDCQLNIVNIHLLEKKDHTPLKEFNPDKEAAIIFTSGSSGKKKALALSFDNFYYSALGSNEFFNLNELDLYPLTLPLNHVGGLLIFIRTLMSGASLFVPNHRNDFYHELKQNNLTATFMSLVLPQMTKLEQEIQVKDLSKLKAIILGGGKIEESKIKEWRSMGLPISLSYGLSESSAQLCSSPTNSNKNLSCGKPLSYRKLILDDDGTIWIGGQTRFLYYFDHQQKIFPFNEQGFFKTSDQGVLDDNNELFIRGRTDLTFTVGGENISPNEIESFIQEIPHIIFAKVIPVPDKRMGNISMCFYQSDFIMTDEEFVSNLSKKMARYKIPHQFIQLSDDFTYSGIKPTTTDLLQWIKRHEH